MLKTTLTLTAVLLLSGAAHAEEKTKTITVETPNYSGERIITRDKEAGTYTRDSELVRKSDGALATGEFDRHRTETGVVASGSQSGFGGKSRSFEYERTRAEDGYTASGSATGRAGNTYTYSGSGDRTDNGYTRNQNWKNPAGETVYNRDVAASRSDGHVTKDVSVTRAQGFKPPRPGKHGPRRGKRGK